MKVKTIKKAMKASARAKGGKVTSLPKQTNKQTQKKAVTAKGQFSVKSNTHGSGTHAQNVPTRTYTRPLRDTMTFSSYSSGGHQGMIVRGFAYLADMKLGAALPSGSGVTRTGYINYLHPDMVSSKVAKMAEAFSMYKFKSLCLTYRGLVGTDTKGQIMMAYTPDAYDDPSILLDRRLRTWYDNVSGSYIGPVYQLGVKPACADFSMKQDDFLSISKSGSEIKEIYQGKIYLGFTDVSDVLLGELGFEYEILMVDPIESIKQIYEDLDIITPITIGANATTAGQAWTSAYTASITKPTDGLFQQDALNKNHRCSTGPKWLRWESSLSPHSSRFLVPVKLQCSYSTR